MEHTTPPALDYNALLRAPHVLIGGTTGSGKSVLLNGIICAILARSPRAAILIDPKRVELSRYRRARACVAYGHTPAQAIALIKDAADMIEWRYKVMERKRQTFTEYAAVYVIVDELADLMLSPEKRLFRQSLQKVLQIGRAANIHVIAATQSPSRQTIPAEIVLNFTHRVALRCLSHIESRQIINAPGAELLPQYGRALMLSPEGVNLYSVPNCTGEDVEKALQAAPRRLFKVGAHIRA